MTTSNVTSKRNTSVPSPTLRFMRALDEIVASLILVLIILLTVAGVVCRYLLNQPLAWQEEISTVLMVWLVFIGCSVVAKRSTPIRIDSLTEMLPPRHRRHVLWAVQVLMLLVLGVVCFYAGLLTLQTQKHTAILKIPYQVVYMAVPISMLLMICYTARDLIQSVRSRRSAH